MAKQPDDLVLRILKQIQATQAEHGKRFDQVERRLDEIHDGMITALGLASHANVRQDTFQRYSPTGTPVAGGPFGGPDGFPDFDPVTIDNANAVKSHWNHVDSAGGRAALKIDLNDQWSITPQIIAQHQKTEGDFAFDPKFGDLNVADYYTPHNTDNWYQSELTVEGKISNWDLVYSGGYFGRKTDNLVDYSQYSIGYDALAIQTSYAYTRFQDSNGQLLDRPVQYTENKDKYTKVSQELRLSSPADFRLRGTVGLFYQRTIFRRWIAPTATMRHSPTCRLTSPTNSS